MTLEIAQREVTTACDNLAALLPPDEKASRSEFLMEALMGVIDSESVENLSGASREFASLLKALLDVYLDNDTSKIREAIGNTLNALTFDDPIMKALGITERMGVFGLVNTLKKMRKK